MRLSKIIFAGVGFFIGSLIAGTLYGFLPADITQNLSAENFKILVEILGAYAGYMEG